MSGRALRQLSPEMYRDLRHRFIGKAITYGKSFEAAEDLWQDTLEAVLQAYGYNGAYAPWNLIWIVGDHLVIDQHRRLREQTIHVSLEEAYHRSTNGGIEELEERLDKEMALAAAKRLFHPTVWGFLLAYYSKGTRYCAKRYKVSEESIRVMAWRLRQNGRGKQPLPNTWTA